MNLTIAVQSYPQVVSAPHSCSQETLAVRGGPEVKSLTQKGSRRASRRALHPAPSVPHGSGLTVAGFSGGIS